MPKENKEMILSSISSKNLVWFFLTICGSKAPLRSQSVSRLKLPEAALTAFGVAVRVGLGRFLLKIMRYSGVSGSHRRLFDQRRAVFSRRGLAGLKLFECASKIECGLVYVLFPVSESWGMDTDF